MEKNTTLSNDINTLKSLISKHQDTTIEIVINDCYGGFGLSKAAYEYLGLEWDGYGCAFDDDRINLKLIEVVKNLGEKANGTGSSLKIEQIYFDELAYYCIDNKEGMESLSKNEGFLILKYFIK